MFGLLHAEVTFRLSQFAEVTFLLSSIVILPLGPKPAHFFIIIQSSARTQSLVCIGDFGGLQAGYCSYHSFALSLLSYCFDLAFRVSIDSLSGPVATS